MTRPAKPEEEREFQYKDEERDRILGIMDNMDSDDYGAPDVVSLFKENLKENISYLHTMENKK